MGAPTIADVPALTGKVIRFEESRGYGFIAPDRGGEDVFLHINDLPTDSDHINCGTKVRFRIIDGGRGPKAYDVQLLDTVGSAAAAAPVPAAAPRATTAATVVGEETDVTCDVLSEQEFRTDVTELILRADAGISAGQVLALRDALCKFAQKHGWLD